MLSETFGRSAGCRAEVRIPGPAGTTGPLLDLAVVATTFGVIFVAELPDKTALASLVLGTRYPLGYAFTGVAAAFAVHVVLAIVAGSLLGLLPRQALEIVVAVLFAVGAVLMLRRRDEDADGQGPRPERGGQQRGGGDGIPAGTPAAHSVGTSTGAPAGASHDATGNRRVRTPAEAADEYKERLAARAVRASGVTTTRASYVRVAATSFAVLFVAEFGDLTQIAIANLAAHYHQPFAVGVGAVAGLWAVGGLALTGGRQLLRLIPFTWITRVAAAVMGALSIVSLIDAVTA